MRKRRILFTLLSLAALAALIWLLLPARESEPIYQGKSLRYWLAFTTTQGNARSDDLTHASEAIRLIGTNAIPTLLEMLQEKDSPLKLKWMALLDKQHFIQPPQPARLRNFQATFGFQMLGPTASNAVPTLVQIYRRKISKASQLATLESLSFIGPAALVNLSKNDPDPSVRADAAYVLKAIDPIAAANAGIK